MVGYLYLDKHINTILLATASGDTHILIMRPPENHRRSSKKDFRVDFEKKKKLAPCRSVYLYFLKASSPERVLEKLYRLDHARIKRLTGIKRWDRKGGLLERNVRVKDPGSTRDCCSKGAYHKRRIYEAQVEKGAESVTGRTWKGKMKEKKHNYKLESGSSSRFTCCFVYLRPSYFSLSNSSFLNLRCLENFHDRERTLEYQRQ